MKASVTGGVLILGLCLAPISTAFAGGTLLAPSVNSAYRACLREAWIQDWCHGNSARFTATYERVYAGCIAANGGGRFSLEGRTWTNTDDFCWAASRTAVWHAR